MTTFTIGSAMQATALRPHAPRAAPGAKRPPLAGAVPSAASGRACAPVSPEAPCQPPQRRRSAAARASAAAPAKAPETAANAGATANTGSATGRPPIQNITSLAEWRSWSDKVLGVKPKARSARQAAALLEALARVTPALLNGDEDVANVEYVCHAATQFLNVRTPKPTHQLRMLRGLRAAIDAHPPLLREARVADSELSEATRKVVESIARKRDVLEGTRRRRKSPFLLPDFCGSLVELTARGVVGRSEFFWEQLERLQAKYPEGEGSVRDAHAEVLALAGTQARLGLGRPPAAVQALLSLPLQRSGGERKETERTQPSGHTEVQVDDTRWEMRPAEAFKALCWQAYLRGGDVDEATAAAARDSLDALEGDAEVAALVRECGTELVPLEGALWALLEERIDVIAGAAALDGEVAAQLCEGLALARMPAREGAMRRLVAHVATNTLRPGYPRAVVALAALHGHLWDPHRACAIMWQALTDEESSGESYAAAPAEEVVWQINSAQSRTVAADVWWERFARGALLSTGWLGGPAYIGVLQPLLDGAGAAAEARPVARAPAPDVLATPPARLGPHALCAVIGRLATKPDAKPPAHFSKAVLGAEAGRVATGVLTPPAWAGAQLAELCSALVALGVPLDTNAKAALRAALARAEGTDKASVETLRAALPELGLGLQEVVVNESAPSEATVDDAEFADLFPI